MLIQLSLMVKGNKTNPIKIDNVLM